LIGIFASKYSVRRYEGGNKITEQAHPASRGQIIDQISDWEGEGEKSNNLDPCLAAGEKIVVYAMHPRCLKKWSD